VTGNTFHAFQEIHAFHSGCYPGCYPGAVMDFAADVLILSVTVVPQTSRMVPQPPQIERSTCIDHPHEITDFLERLFQ